MNEMSNPVDAELRNAIAAIRTHWRRRRIVEGVPVLVAAALLALCIGLAVRAVATSPAVIILATRLIGYTLLAIAAARFLLWPAMRHVSDEQIAHYVDEEAPASRQLIVSAVHELNAPETNASPALRARLLRQAAAEVARLEAGASWERPRVRRAAGRAAAIVAAGVLMIVAGPVAVREMARVLFVPWSHAAAATVPMLSIAPGNVSIPRGAALDIHADVRALADHGAEIVLRADSSESETRLAMVRDSTGTGYVARLFDVNHNTTYHVEAAGLRSPDYRITVTDLPTVKQLAVELHYPAYTGIKPEKIDNGGDVVAVTGTTASLTIRATLPIRAGSLRFDDGTTLPLAIASDGQLSGGFKIAHDGFYRVDLIAADGTAVPGSVQHSVEALVDHPPTIRIDKPGRDTRVTAIEEVPLSIRASDDFGVQSVELHYAVNGGADHLIPLTDSLHRSALDFSALHTLFLEEFGLHVGDLVAYHATARDGAGNHASSDIYFMEVRPLAVNYRSADDNAGGGGGGGGGGNNPGKLTERQRDLIVGTFNWERDSARTSDRDRRANATTLAIGQGKLHSDVVERITQMVQRGMVREDSQYVLVMAELDSAARMMVPAEDGLGRHVMSDAIPAQEKALQHLQAADDAFRDITIRQQKGGGGGGGGGGGAQNSQDLADLFELQTDKLKNQYETPRGEASTASAGQQALDSTQDKLKALAARQLEENERQQRLAQEMSQRLGAQQGGSGAGGQAAGQAGAQPQRNAQQLARSGSGGATGSAQRELARQAEETARQLEKLSREQNAPEIADAAQRMQQAADAMRQAAAGSPQQGAAAMDRLRDAMRQLQGAQTSAQGNAIQGLAQRSDSLGREQQAIARDVAALGSAPAADQPPRADALGRRKDALAAGVSALQADADRTAQQLRRDQPKSAATAQGAADEIRNRRLVDEINYSKSVMRSGSQGYSREYEQEIGETLDSVTRRLAAAAGAIGTSRGEQQAQALDRTRDLVRDLESLRDRTVAAAGTTQGAAGQPGTPGQPGQPTPGQPGSSATPPAGSGRAGAGQGATSPPGSPGQAGQTPGQGTRGQGQGGRGQGQGQGQSSGQGQSPGQGQPGQGQGNRGQGRSGQGQGGQGQRGQGQGPSSGQPGGGGLGDPTRGEPQGTPVNGDPRQFRREVGARREAAESLRTDLAHQGVDVGQLDHAIAALKELQEATNAGKIDDLQAAVVAQLKEFEFSVWRKFNGDGGSRPALGAAQEVDPKYRAMVEEYYRALARNGPR